MSVTSFPVGTTTMRFGVARHGPSAPDASQLGKKEVRTITGTPMRSTWNEIESTPVVMSVTLTGGSGRRSGSSPEATRCHPSGPPMVRGTAVEPCWNTSTAGSSQPAWSTSTKAAGSTSIGTTISAPATANTVHGPLVANSVRSGCPRPRFTARSEKAA